MLAGPPSVAGVGFGEGPSLNDPVTITMLGAPQGKGRARSFIRGDHVGHYTPEKTVTYEGMIRTTAMQELAGRRCL